MPQMIDSYLQTNLKARHLRLLVALDNFGNLKQVAEISHVTVPAVSKALAEIERGLGLDLFSRTGQGLRPTLYGECLIRHARSILINISQARDELRALSSGTEARIHIGVLPGSSSILLPRALALLKQRAPSTSVLVTEGTSTSLMPELWQGKLEMIVGRLPRRDVLAGFEEKELLEDPVVMLTRRDHPLVHKKKLKWADLQNFPWVLPPAGSLLRDPLERILERHDITLGSHNIETLSAPLARAYLNMSDAIGVMAVGTAKDPAQPLAVLPLALPRLLRPAGALWNKSRPLSPGAGLLLSCLDEAAAKLSGSVSAKKSTAAARPR